MTIWEAVLLGIIQGLTEFLPISSSGHLVLAKYLLGIEITDIAFEVFVHLGTLLAVLTFFKHDVIVLLKSLRLLISFRLNSKILKGNNEDLDGLRLLGYLIVATLPAATLGYLFEDKFKQAFSFPEFTCGALIFTGLILIASKFAIEKQPKFNLTKSLLVGLTQVAAILPGISRSGTTISTGLLLGVQRVESARFSFLLAVPLIIGASLMQGFELISHFHSGEEFVTIVVGTITAYLSGLLAIRWLMGVIQHGRFDRFAYYCFSIGIIGLIYFGFNN
ncbi:MAG: undecaprenyl-diphosphate phosphatase [bacterium]